MRKFCVRQIISLLIFLIGFLCYGQTADSVKIETKLPPNGDKLIPALNFKDTDIRDIYRGIAIGYETNIMLDNRIERKVSVALFNLSVHDAIKVITEDNNLEFYFDENRFFVKMKEQNTTEIEQIENEPKVTYYNKTNKIDIDLENVSVEKFVEEIVNLTGKNFLLTKGSHGKLKGKLINIDFETGIKNILQNNGFYYTLRDSIYYINKSYLYKTDDEKNGTVSDNYWVDAKSIFDISLKVKNVDLDLLLDDLTNQLNLQVVKLDIPESKVNISCSNLHIDKVLYYLFKGSDYTFKKEEDAYIIGQRKENNLNGLYLFKLKHLRAEIVNKQIPDKLFNGVTTDISKELNAILISGTHDAIIEVKEYLNLIDKPVPQVMIEAIVVDYNLDNTLNMGIKAGTGDSLAASKPDTWGPGLDVTVSGSKINKIFKDIDKVNFFGKDLNIGKLGNLPKDFYMNLNLLEKDGIANVKSRPILSTLNGHTASLKIGTVQNYVFKEIMPIASQVNTSFLERERVEKIEASISFEITPWVGPNGELTLEIKPDFQTPIGQFSPDKRLIPAINTRTLESTVKLRDGETIVLGGLIQEVENSTVEKTPFFGDIPLLGALFTSTSKTKKKGELVIYLTPRVFYDEKFGFEELEYAKEE